MKYSFLIIATLFSLSVFSQEPKNSQPPRPTQQVTPGKIQPQDANPRYTWTGTQKQWETIFQSLRWSKGLTGDQIEVVIKSIKDSMRYEKMIDTVAIPKPAVIIKPKAKK